MKGPLLNADSMIKLALGPVLLAQGKYVRKTVEILPEPEGSRVGVLGEGPPLRLLVLGDSAAAGVGAEHQDEALLGQLVSDLARDYQVEFLLEASTGSTTRSTARRLSQKNGQPFDVAVTSLGVNDATRLLADEVFLKNQAQVMTLLRDKFQVKHIMVSGLPPMHLFPALPQPLRWVIGRRAQGLDRSLADWLQQFPDCQFMKSDYSLNPALMARDGFHPAPALYRMWATEVATQIRARLST